MTFLHIPHFIAGNAKPIFRQTIPEQVLNVNAVTVSPFIDKRGYSAVGVIISANFTGTKIRYQVSMNGAPEDWTYLIDPATGTPYEATLLATSQNAFMIDPSVFPFPLVRIVFLNASNVQQTQTNVKIKYALVA
jgi:hypothetical protein